MSSNKKRQRTVVKSQPEKSARITKNALIKPSQVKRSQQENRPVEYNKSDDDGDDIPLPPGRRRRGAEPLKQVDKNRGRQTESESTDELDYFSPSKAFRRSSSTAVGSDGEPSLDEDEDEDEDEDSITDKNHEKRGRYVDDERELNEGLFAAPRPQEDVVRAKKRLTPQKIVEQDLKDR